MVKLLIVYYAVLAMSLWVSTVPVGKSLFWRGFDEGSIGVCLHASPDLWWLLTLYHKGRGVEIYLSSKPYWSPTQGYTRRVGIRLWRISAIIYLGLTGREPVIRQPPTTWYDISVN